MFGSRRFSHATYETAENQGRFAYYANDADRKKYDSINNTTMWYWEASPSVFSTSYFCIVNANGSALYYLASSIYGCAPAFCVK
jgi:hypothetical protein